MNLLGQATRYARHLRNILDRRPQQSTHTAKTGQKPLTALWPDRLHVVELRGVTGTCATRAHAGYGKAMRFVPNLGNQHQCRRFPAKTQGRAPVGKYQFLRADLAALALGNPNQQPGGKSKIDENLARDRDLPGTPINEDEVRHRRLTACRLSVAPRQHLAHRPIIVAADQPFDVEASIFRTAHCMVGIHHARRLRGLAGRMANIEAFDTQCVGVIDIESQDID